MSCRSLKSKRKRWSYPLDRERRRRVMIALAEKELTASALAEVLCISKTLVSLIICGRRRSELTEMFIADYLGKSSDYLFPARTQEEILKMRQAEDAQKRKVS